MTAGRSELEERRDQALRDLADLRRQVADGEIDPATADRLRTRYEAETAAALEALAALEDGERFEKTTRSDGARTGRTSRRLVGALALLAMVAAAATLLPRYLAPRPAGGFVTGNEQTGGRDLGTVSNEELEQVVAANPDVVGMRLALARRYFEAGEYPEALGHYRQVLEREPHPEALANVGWILFTSSKETEAAKRFVEESLRRDPSNPLAAYFLATIRLRGFGDAQGAAELARQLLARRDLTPQDRSTVEQLLEQAERQLPGEGP